MNYVIFFIYSTLIQAMNQILLCSNIWCSWFSHSSQILVCISLRYLNILYEFLVNIQHTYVQEVLALLVNLNSAHKLTACSTVREVQFAPAAAKGQQPQRQQWRQRKHTHAYTALQACVPLVCVCLRVCLPQWVQRCQEKKRSWEGRGGEGS